jgi:hypothetical protein
LFKSNKIFNNTIEKTVTCKKHKGYKEVIENRRRTIASDLFFHIKKRRSLKILKNKNKVILKKKKLIVNEREKLKNKKKNKTSINDWLEGTKTENPGMHT